ncbi:(R)-mandelonitrile lyase [Mangrovibacter yixingensis]|uniref:(R)-mandelonitrile lyase n=1 Tax=Mangrovibacter yixingensis TaxID=1529639 RepID=UPI001CFAE42A
MIRFTSAVAALAMFAGVSAHAETSQHMSISPSGSRAYVAGPEATFTGKAWIDPLFLSPKKPQRASAGLVTFEPGARSAWHTHPLGQTLVITAGTGWVQEWGGERKVVHAGDVVACPPGVKHWHGATDKTAMTHIAIQEMDDSGKSVEWLGKVSDEQYNPVAAQ